MRGMNKEIPKISLLLIKYVAGHLINLTPKHSRCIGAYNSQNQKMIILPEITILSWLLSNF